MQSPISNNAIRQILFLLLILAIGTVLFLELSQFIPALLGAYTLYVLLRGWMHKLEFKKKWKPWVAAATLMIISFIVIIFPIFLLVNMLGSKIGFAVQHSGDVLGSIKTYVHQYEVRYQFEILSDGSIKKLTAWAAGVLPNLLGATISTATTIVIMYFILYFMLTERNKMEASFYSNVPLKDENILLLRREMNSLVYSNALGIPLIAVLQGVVALIGYLILGVEQPWFWFVVTCIAAMLPIVGAAVAYVPLSLVFFANGHDTKGIILLFYGLGIVGTVDNIFRFWMQKKLGDTHPLITVFGVIIGLNLFGFIGLIFGPILIALFLLLLRIYTNEFK
ncbi:MULTISPECIES: AI-2E family transporter [unclassified Paraflavitalea]|uniref:AI-2E family transporter n=1 Tax=unclassified Paraflavitalea TaxID=2798305 RepID=UPI003D334579